MAKSFSEIISARREGLERVKQEFDKDIQELIEELKNKKVKISGPRGIEEVVVEKCVISEGSPAYWGIIQITPRGGDSHTKEPIKVCENSTIEIVAQ